MPSERIRPASRTARRRLVIVEERAPQIACTLTHGLEAVVVSQLPGEEPAELAKRALHRIAIAERNGRPFHEAYLCMAATDGAATRGARRLITLGVAAHADAVHSLNELVLCASADADFGRRDALVRLADDAVLAGKDKPLRVRLCFIEDELRPDPSLTLERTPELVSHQVA